jgi:hypothetical protein
MPTAGGQPRMLSSLALLTQSLRDQEQTIYYGEQHCASKPLLGIREDKEANAEADEH